MVDRMPILSTVAAQGPGVATLEVEASQRDAENDVWNIRFLFNTILCIVRPYYDTLYYL